LRFEADGHRLERQDTGFTLGTVFTTFQPERHALVMKGEVGSAELKQIYAIATAGRDGAGHLTSLFGFLKKIDGFYLEKEGGIISSLC